MFRKYQGIKLSYNEQGLIYFICLNYFDMPEAVKRKITKLCFEVGQKQHKALFELLTNEHKTISDLTDEYSVSKNELYRLRREFYKKM